MNWRDELNDVFFDRENVTKSYIRDELKKYYLYMSDYLDVKNKLHLLDIKYAGYLDDPVNTTSFIKVGDKATESKNRVVEWEGEIYETKATIKALENKMDELDSWLNCLNDSYREIVKNYVCKRGCTGSLEVAEEMTYSQSHVLQATKTAIDRIYLNFFVKNTV